MIKMEQPSFCFNSCDIGEPYYEIWRTMVGPKGMTPRQLVGAIATANQAALNSWGCPLVNVIINSHGTFGSIYIGGLKKPNGEYEHPMDEDDLGVFGVLKSLKIDTIWLVSCRAAFGKTGPSFCQTLANVAGTEVIAADGQQIVTAWQGIELFLAGNGYIDDFEGTVYSFTQGKGMAKGIDPDANYRRKFPLAGVTNMLTTKF
jgi:hypothetical protein